jgi:osmotically-inducible protein OsmY
VLIPLRLVSRPLTSLSVLAFTILLSFLGTCAAGDTPVWLPSLSQSGEVAIHDLELTLKARRALFKNNAFTGYSLGINVRNRVATLWGTVPSPELSRQAEETMQGVLGLSSVRNELQVEKPCEYETKPLRVPGADANLPFPKTTLSEPPRTPGVVVRRPAEPAITADPELRWRAPQDRLFGFEDRCPKPGAMTGRETPLPLKKPSPAEATIPPITLLSPTTTSSREAPARASVTASSDVASDLTKAVESLRLSDKRFQRIVAAVRGGTVYLGGSVYRWDHLHELARSISHLPGVRDVVFEDVQADVRD